MVFNFAGSFIRESIKYSTNKVFVCSHLEVAEFRVPLLPKLSGTKQTSAGGGYVPLLPQVVWVFASGVVVLVFSFFLRDSWVFIIVGFVITRALTVYKCIILPQTGFETLADLQAPVSFELRFFVCPFEKGRQNLIFSVEPKCDLNIRPASVHWITVKY